MAKTQSAPPKDKPRSNKMPNVKGQSSRALGQLLRKHIAESGDDTEVSATGMAKMLIGVPFPAICLEFLYTLTHYPLGRLEMIVGKERSGKSAYGVEHMRWFRKYCDGVGIAFDCEDKWADELARALLGYAKEDEWVMGVERCRTTEEWQTQMNYWQRHFVKEMTNKKVRGKTVSQRFWPVLMMLDSLSGRIADKTSENIRKKGHAERRYSHEAKLHTDWLKNFVASIAYEPFTLLIINHLKEGQSEGMSYAPERVRPGGVQSHFSETFEVECTRMGNKPVERAGKSGETMQIKCFKNSLGITGRAIRVTKWVHRETMPDQTSRLHASFDWAAANINLLVNMPNESLAKAGLEISGVVSVNANKAYSKRLGVSRDNAVSYHELGVLLQKNKEVKKELRELWGITPVVPFMVGTDYRAQRAILRKPLMKGLEKLENEKPSRTSSEKGRVAKGGKGGKV